MALNVSLRLLKGNYNLPPLLMRNYMDMTRYFLIYFHAKLTAFERRYDLLFAFLQSQVKQSALDLHFVQEYRLGSFFL